MSLDITILGAESDVECRCHCGHLHTHKKREELYTGHITHNLNVMATSADLYIPLWRPEELGITTTAQILPHLEAGLKNLKADPVGLKKLEPSNGFGTYYQLVSFVESYIQSCKDHPEAIIEVSR